MSEDVELFKKTLGKQLARLRNEKGYTQAELSALINKDFQSISRIENGKVNPSAFVLKQISIALGVNISALYEGK